MDIMELGAIGELIGGVAVIVSLVYVGLQVRQNTRQLQSQARYQILEGLGDDAKRLSESDQFEMVMSESPHPLVSGEDRFRWLWTSWVSRHEILFYEISQGTVPRGFEKTLRFRLFQTFAFARASSLWNEQRNYFTDEFQGYVDRQLAGGFSDFAGSAA